MPPRVAKLGIKRTWTYCVHENGEAHMLHPDKVDDGCKEGCCGQIAIVGPGPGVSPPLVHDGREILDRMAQGFGMSQVADKMI